MNISNSKKTEIGHAEINRKRAVVGSRIDLNLTFICGAFMSMSEIILKKESNSCFPREVPISTRDFP